MPTLMFFWDVHLRVLFSPSTRRYAVNAVFGRMEWIFIEKNKNFCIRHWGRGRGCHLVFVTQLTVHHLQQASFVDIGRVPLSVTAMFCFACSFSYYPPSACTV